MLQTHKPAGLLAYGCGDGRVGVISVKTQQAQPFSQRHFGPVLDVGWQQQAAASAPPGPHQHNGGAEPPPPPAAGAAGEAPAPDAPQTEDAGAPPLPPPTAAASPPPVPKSARPAVLYSIGGEGCVLRWPTQPPTSGSSTTSSSRGGAGSGAASWQGAGGQPVDVSPALEEAFQALQQRQPPLQVQQQQSDGGGGGSGEVSAAAGVDQAAAASPAAAPPAATKWTAMAWHPDGRLLAVGTDTGAVVLFASSTGSTPPPTAIPATAAAAGERGGGNTAAAGSGWTALAAFVGAGGLPILQLRWGQAGGRAVLAAADQRRGYLCDWRAAGAGGGEGAAPRVQATAQLESKTKGIRGVCLVEDGLLCVAQGDGRTQVRGLVCFDALQCSAKLVKHRTAWPSRHAYSTLQPERIPFPGLVIRPRSRAAAPPRGPAARPQRVCAVCVRRAGAAGDRGVRLG